MAVGGDAGVRDRLDGLVDGVGPVHSTELSELR